MAQIPRISETRLDFLKELANIGVEMQRLSIRDVE